MIKNIIFDYGNVIFDIDHQLTIQAFQDLGIQHDKGFFGHLQQNPLFDEFEKGNITPAQFRNEVRIIAEQEFSDEQIDKAWNTLLLGIRPGYLEFLLEIKSQYRTFLLSNNNEIHYNWINNYLQNVYNVPNMSQFFDFCDTSAGKAFWELGCKNLVRMHEFESQRDSVPQPRVARAALPWESTVVMHQPQRGCVLLNDVRYGRR